MKEWYTTQEVMELLNISNVTVYNYAKQNKIIKVDDPYRNFKSNRYFKEEVDHLIEQRNLNTASGIKPSDLAKKLNVPTQRIYNLIKNYDLQVDTIPLGEERFMYSIPPTTESWITAEINRTAPSRGKLYDFYNKDYDIAIYQLLKTSSNHTVRVMKNESNEWGIYLNTGIWVPYSNHKDKYNRVYDIHKNIMDNKGYTDFSLPKNDELSFDFIDFVYNLWGIENIRMRDSESYISLSVKSGKFIINPNQTPLVSIDNIKKMITSGGLEVIDNLWIFRSGHRRTTFDLKTTTLDAVSEAANAKGITMSEFVELAIQEKLDLEGLYNFKKE